MGHDEVANDLAVIVWGMIKGFSPYTNTMTLCSYQKQRCHLGLACPLVEASNQRRQARGTPKSGRARTQCLVSINGGY